MADIRVKYDISDFRKYRSDYNNKSIMKVENEEIEF